MKEEYKSRVYTDRPDYADYPAPKKFQTIQAIIAKHLTEHPNAICSYSGGSDSDIMIDLIERTRKLFCLPPIKYAFFNTGLEMKATKDHVKVTAEKYGVEITEYRPKVNIIQATRQHGVPFISKTISDRMERWHQSVPLSIADEYINAEDKPAMRAELSKRYPRKNNVINFICSCNTAGVPQHSQLTLNSQKYLRDYLEQYPPDFKISAKCCEFCKKDIAHAVEKGFDMIITGERMSEGGLRTLSPAGTGCFTEKSNGQYRLRPLYYVSDADKAWYKDYYGIRYSDAYEVYGLTRTGCCGCPISYKAVEYLEKIRPYEPQVVKAAWNIFGKSYEYRQKYNAYKAKRDEVK